jgi:K+-transporting ATPase ATPase C chain
VAGQRAIDVGDVLALVDDHTEDRTFGVLGEPGVNVVLLNVALDDLTAG